MRPSQKSICKKADKILEMDPYDRDLELSMIWFLAGGIDKNVVNISPTIKKQINETTRRYFGWTKDDFRVLHFLIKGSDELQE